MRNIPFLSMACSLLYVYTPLHATSKPAEQPNIIFILTDDQRWDALGYAGNEIIVTPEMDRLAREGVCFKHGIVSTPICSASRASIFTGLYERTHKYSFQTSDILHEYMEYSYPKLLNDAGYYTGFFGKFGVNYASKNNFFNIIDDYDRNGRFHDYRGYFYKTLDNDTVHLTRYTGQQALDFLENAPIDRPFCLSLSFSAPHAHDPAPLQWFWTEQSDHLYRDMVMPPPAISEDRYFNELPEAVREGFNRLRWGWRFDTPEKYQHSIKGYYRMIHDIDLEIAKIRAKLKEQGLDKNTVIIFTGDNGFFLGERQLAGKWLMHDHSIRVPFIIYDPRVKNPVDTEKMALNIDIAATILDIAGLDIPDTYHGVSLMPLVNNSSGIERDTVLIEHLWEFEHIPPSEGVRTNEWKYFRYVNDHSLEELYYLPDDPLEIHNLAANPDSQDVLRTMRNQLNKMIGRYADPYSGVPHGMMVEYIRKPANARINNRLPRYSWIVPQKAVSQNAWQILVASSQQNIDMNIGDVWDSGQRRGRSSTSVVHEGEALQPETNYFWKVRIWDQHNRLSAYTEAQRFRTGDFTGYISTGNTIHIEEINPKEIIRTAAGSYFVDFGRAAFGTLNITYHTTTYDTLVVRMGEKRSGYSVDMNPGGTIRARQVVLPVSPRGSTYTLMLEPDERNTNHMAVPWPDTLDVVLPFRYVEVENYRHELLPENIIQLAHFGYFNEDESYFISNDTILNQVWDICKYSIKATNFMGYYIDGDRERIPYEADAYINMLSHYGVDREYTIGKQTIEWFMEKPTWPTEWQLHMAMLFYKDYMYTGDLNLIRHYYEQLKHKTLMALEYEHGLISTGSPNHNEAFMANLGFSDTSIRLRDIVDWPPAQKDTGWKLATEEGERDGFVFMPVNTVVNSFYYRNMVIMAFFARLLDKHDDAIGFDYRAARVKKSINTYLFDVEKGHYVDGIGTDHGAVHSNMLPLAFGIVPEGYVGSVVKYTKSRGMACSVYGAQYLLEAMYLAGEAGYALELMTATHDRSWWNMIASGSTITLEAWDLKYKPNLDWNHAWGAAPANIIPRFLWGVRPAEPGFDLITIQPQPTPLTNTSIVVPTIKGPVKASYELVTNRLKRYQVEIPANTGALFSPPIADNEVMTLNGVRVNPVFGSVRLEPGVNTIEIRMNSF
jgi:alpha-L-rhamnosidase